MWASKHGKRQKLYEAGHYWLPTREISTFSRTRAALAWGFSLLSLFPICLFSSTLESSKKSSKSHQGAIKEPSKNHQRTTRAAASIERLASGARCLVGPVVFEVARPGRATSSAASLRNRQAGETRNRPRQRRPAARSTERLTTDRGRPLSGRGWLTLDG